MRLLFALFVVLSAQAKKKGVIEKDFDMTKFWQNNDILWHHGLKEMHLVLKDDKNLHAHKRPDPEKFFPTKVRMTLIQVAKGSTYDPKRMPERVK